MNSVVLYLGPKNVFRHSKTPKTIGFTMVLEPFRVRETRQAQNQRALEENPKRILTRVRVHVFHKNDDGFHTFLKIRRFCMKKTGNAIKPMETIEIRHRKGIKIIVLTICDFSQTKYQN